MEWNIQPNVKSKMDFTDEFYEKRSDIQKFFAQEIKECKAFVKEAFTEVFFKLAKLLPPNEADVQPTAEHGEELNQLTEIFFSNETDLQLPADYYITQEKLEAQQGGDEEGLENEDDNWILLDEGFVYGEQEVLFQEREFCPAGQQEEDLADKREAVSYFVEQLDYKTKWMLLDEQCIYVKQEDMIQERKTQLKKQLSHGAEEIQKRDLLLGRVALLWPFIWLKKRPRIRLK